MAVSPIFSQVPIAESTGPASKTFPEQQPLPKGAPNILLVMTDDVGFAASSTFGGPISTPTFDALAKVGLRYNQFHTTALCSPTRAALLTGRNQHLVGSGAIPEIRQVGKECVSTCRSRWG